MSEPRPGTSPDGDYLVVVGSSAGGIEALSILVSRLPTDFPAPIVVAQHLDPRRPSHLAEILERRSTLPVITVTKRQNLKPGNVYVVPSNRHVSVTDHAISVTHPRGAGPVPSVDRLLTTAAEVFGERLIAVILTGSGSDGAAGARRVKAAGGTVVAQDPETARFPSMPAALPPAIVDVVAGVEAIAPLLHDLLRGAYEPARPEDERTLKTFLSRLREQTGIDFASYKRATVLRRLQRRMAATGSHRLRDYVRHLDGHPDEYQRLASSLLIKVTEFFRDPQIFEHVRTAVLPGLIEEGRRRGRELRLWSAGCATGEEAYTLAILVAEALGDEIGEWSIRVFATDLDGEAVAFARRAVYPAATLDEMPSELVERHFSKIDGEYEVRKHIRAITVFGQHDLAVRAPFPRIDLVLCRNVLIYFTPELQKRALQLFAFALRDGGSLVLGKAETTSPLSEYFAVEEPRLKIYRRRGERLVVPPPRRSAVPLVPHPVAFARRIDGADHGLELEQARVAMDRAETIVADLPVGIVIVRGDYDITLINTVARRLLGIHGAAVGQDIIHLLRDVAPAEIRDAVDGAIKGTPTNLTTRLDPSRSVEVAGHWLRIDCLPHRTGVDDRGAVIVVRDVTDEVEARSHAEAERLASRDEVRRLEARVAGLLEANRRLLGDNDELTRVNTMLRSSNEDMLVANEEVQAATEEVETLNEELQSTNEELETLNEELQATVEELNTTNDDMQARALELQSVATSLEEQQQQTEIERGRLAAVIGSQPDGILVVDGAGHEIVRNERYDAIMGGHDFRADDESGAVVTERLLRERIARGEQFAVQLRAIGEDGRRRWYEAYGRPVPAGMAIGGGGILVVHDTTDLSLRRLQEEFVAIVAHELRTPLTALRGYLQMIEPGEPGDGRIVVLAGEQADRLARLVDELFDAARADSGVLTVEKERVGIVRLVEQTVDIARSLSPDREITLDREGGEIHVDGDPGRLQQVILNLLTNAIVHAPASPEIRVRVRRLRRRAEIEVEDHGPGVPEDVRDRIFSRFQGAAVGRHGLGLGLYIAREIVTAHGGTIELDSEVGEGTTFTVRLPLAAASGKSAARDARTTAEPGRSGRLGAR